MAPFKRQLKLAVQKIGLRARGAVTLPCIERKNSETFAHNLAEPVAGFSACACIGMLAPMNDASEAFKSRSVSRDITQ